MVNTNRTKIFEFKNYGLVPILSDWNSRVANKRDVITFDRYDSGIDDDDYVPDSYIVRSSVDWMDLWGKHV